MNAKAPVLLVQMPFAYLLTPALGLSILKAILKRERIPSRILYFNFLFARRFGAGRYLTEVEPHISEGSNLFGEWIFSGSVFDQSPEAVEEYLARVSEAPRDSFGSSGGPERPAPVALVRELRGRVDAFLDHCVEEISRCRPRIVAFTSMFQQHLGCLALARRLKERIPEVFVLLGGVNCEKVKGMETARAFPWVDAVVSGEGDLVLPQIVKAVLEGREIPNLPGVAVQGRIPPPGSAEERIDAPAVRDLDELPVPDFSEYFTEVERIRKEAPLDPVLLLESSRGCWWRRKKGCHFCSLNLHGSAYRVKSARKAIEEIVHAAGSYPVKTVQMTDTVLPPSYPDDFFPGLKEAKTGVRVFYEVRTNLTRRQLQTMREAGVTCIQPGIESLSDRILEMMNKGTTTLLNIQMLKWCRELEIEAVWNLLWGFPFEPPEEYDRMAEMLPLLTHLQPPSGFSQIYLARHSNHFEHAAAFGFVNVRPVDSYRHIYSLDGDSIDRLAHYFDFDYASGQRPKEYVAPLEKAVRDWRDAWPSSVLYLADDPVRPVLWDTRPAAARKATVLSPLQKSILLACGENADAGQVVDFVRERTREGFSEAAVARELEGFLAAGVMIRSGGRYLSLAVSVAGERKAALLPHVEAVLAREAAEAEYRKLRRKIRLGEMERETKVGAGEKRRALRDFLPW